MAKWYYSPSSQQSNTSHGYNEEVWNNELTDIIMVIMQRHGEECKRNNPKNTYAMHVIEANAWKADFIVPEHSNAIVSDANTWQTTRSGPTVGCSNPEMAVAKGTILANMVNDRLFALWQLATKRKVVKYTFTEVTKSNMPCIYIENFYHDNESNQKFAIAYREQIAIEQCKAFLEMVGKVYDGLEEIAPMYRVQVGAFRNKAYADDFVNKLALAGFTGGRIKVTME